MIKLRKEQLWVMLYEANLFAKLLITNGESVITKIVCIDSKNYLETPCGAMLELIILIMLFLYFYIKSRVS